MIPYDVILSCKQWEVLTHTEMMREGDYSQEISLETFSSTRADFPLHPLKLNFDQVLWVATAGIMRRAVASKSWIPGIPITSTERNTSSIIKSYLHARISSITSKIHN